MVQGKLPKDFWGDEGSFNGNGGNVFLGVKEKKGEFSIQGIKNIQSIIDELFSTLNNQNKVSVNLLSDEDVQAVTLPEAIFFTFMFFEQRANKRFGTMAILSRNL